MIQRLSISNNTYKFTEVSLEPMLKLNFSDKTLNSVPIFFLYAYICMIFYKKYLQSINKL